jgi:hypothetical protein
MLRVESRDRVSTSNRMRALLLLLLVLCAAALMQASAWSPRIPAQFIPVPDYSISDPSAPSPPKLADFEKARPSLNDSEIWALSVRRCNARGLYVYNSAEPWCDCHAGWKGTTCAFEDKRALRNAIIFLAYGSYHYLDVRSPYRIDISHKKMTCRRLRRRSRRWKSIGSHRIHRSTS